MADSFAPVSPSCLMLEKGTRSADARQAELQNPEDSTNLANLVDFLSRVLDNVYSGIIVCNRDCRIVFMNRVYGELIGIEPKNAVGKHIEEYFPNSRLPQVLTSGRAELGQRCALRTSTPLLVNRIPLKRGSETIGVILQTIFRDYKAFTDLIARMNVLEREVNYYKKGLTQVLSARYSLESIIGQSPAMEQVKEVCRKYAQTDAPVLILGATGTGKEMFAHAVHNASLRFAGPFVCVNCAAIPRDLLESELFGYESGAFTGAHKKGKVGQIQLAHQGTLYLDEIGDLPLNAQAKLLRVLETKMLDKLGGVKPLQVDFRLVAATNRDLRAMMVQGQFRDDLYYRLSTMSLEIPPMSQRREDIPLLLQHCLKTLGKSDYSFSGQAMEAMMAYDWPGNVRELKNVVERSVSLSEDKIINIDKLPLEVIKRDTSGDQMSGIPHNTLSDALARCEKDLIEAALRHTGGNMSKACKLLKISRSTLYEKCRRHEILAAKDSI